MAAAACARDNLARVIRPGLADGRDYACDRIHAVSSLVYGAASRCDPIALRMLVRATQPPPARWFVLQAPWEAILDRRPPGRDVWDRRGADFAARVCELYRSLDGWDGDLEREIRAVTGWGPPTAIDAAGEDPWPVADAILRALDAPEPGEEPATDAAG